MTEFRTTLELISTGAVAPRMRLDSYEHMLTMGEVEVEDVAPSMLPTSYRSPGCFQLWPW